MYVYVQYIQQGDFHYVITDPYLQGLC